MTPREAVTALSAVNWLQPAQLRTDGRVVAAELKHLLAGLPVQVHRQGPRGVLITLPPSWPGRRADGLLAFVAALLSDYWRVRYCADGIVARWPLAGKALVRARDGRL